MGSFSVLAEQKVQEKAIRKRFFALGLASGIGFCMVLAAGALALLMVRGITVPMDSHAVATLVKERVERESKRELPAVMARLAEDAPRAMAGKLESRKGITLRMLDSDIRLPKRVVRELDRQIERKLGDALARAAVEYDTAPLVSIIGRSAFRMVNESLGKEINGRRVPVRLNPWLSIPVTVDVN